MDKNYAAKIGSSYRNETGIEWPMYSFNSAAYTFWNGFANGLRERGLTDNEIKDELQSKGTRWLLDNEGDRISELGREMAKTYDLCVTK